MVRRVGDTRSVITDNYVWAIPIKYEVKKSG
jgi:hypothetical protein